MIKDLQMLEKEISITETRRRFMDKLVGRATRIGGRVNKLFEFAVLKRLALLTIGGSQ